MTAKNPAILVFDSGVGGLSIVSHIHTVIPAAQLTYVADNALFPYGILDDQVLIDRVIEILTAVTRQHQPDIIVIACNSASTLVLPRLRDIFSIPIVGVVPAIKPAAQHSKTKVIGLLATPGTIKRDYTDELIADFAQGCEVIRCGSAELVNIVEAKLAGQPQPADAFKQVLAPFINHPRYLAMDTVVLACTHFPLVKTELAAIAPHINFWVDSGAAIARRIHSLLVTNLQIQRVDQQDAVALFTNVDLLNPSLRQNLHALGFKTISALELTPKNAHRSIDLML